MNEENTPPHPIPRRPTDALLDSVYTELRELAHSKMRRERPGQTISATELVHEAYLRLRNPNESGWENRSHFFGAAAEAMRRLLIERARAKGREKRGGDSEGNAPRRISFADIPVADLSIDYDAAEILSLESAVNRLEQNDARAAQVVRLRFYGGLSIDETAEALGIGESTVKRDWTFAKAWLVNELGSPGSSA